MKDHGKDENVKKKHGSGKNDKKDQNSVLPIEFEDVKVVRRFAIQKRYDLGVLIVSLAQATN